MLAGKGVIKSVPKHAVVELAVAEPIAPAAAADEEGRLVHVLHAAGHSDVDVAQQDFLRRGHDRLRARAADPIDGHRGHGHRKPGVDDGLTGRIHLRASLDDIAHRRGLDFLGLHPRPFDGGANRDSAEVRRWYVLESAAKGADRRADRFRDNR